MRLSQERNVTRGTCIELGALYNGLAKRLAKSVDLARSRLGSFLELLLGSKPELRQSGQLMLPMAGVLAYMAVLLFQRFLFAGDGFDLFDGFSGESLVRGLLCSNLLVVSSGVTS